MSKFLGNDLEIGRFTETLLKKNNLNYVIKYAVIDMHLSRQDVNKSVKNVLLFQ